MKSKNSETKSLILKIGAVVVALIMVAGIVFEAIVNMRM